MRLRLLPLLALAFIPGPAFAQTVMQVDLSGAFTGDYVRNTGDRADDVIDGSSNALLTASIAGSSSFGLPDNGRFAANADHPAIELAATDTNAGFNGVLLRQNGSVSITVPTRVYSRLQLYGLATEGAAVAEITIAYTDGTEARQTFTMPDWFTDPAPSGMFQIIDGMYRYSVTGEHRYRPGRGSDRAPHEPPGHVFDDRR